MLTEYVSLEKRFNMRIERVYCKARATVVRRTPWACAWLYIELGIWLAFESLDDYNNWLRK